MNDRQGSCLASLSILVRSLDVESERAWTGSTYQRAKTSRQMTNMFGRCIEYCTAAVEMLCHHLHYAPALLTVLAPLSLTSVLVPLQCFEVSAFASMHGCRASYESSL